MTSQVAEDHVHCQISSDRKRVGAHQSARHVVG